MIIPNENTFRVALQTGVNLFVGSGFATLSYDKQNKLLPSGAALQTELIVRFKKPALKSLALDMVSQSLKRTNRDEFDLFLRQRFTVDRYTKIYENLFKANINRIFTTNIDTLIPTLYDQNDAISLNNVLKNGVAVLRDTFKTIDYYPLHGYAGDPESEFVFGRDEISKAYFNNINSHEHLRSALLSKPTVIVGYSVNDFNIYPIISDSVEVNSPQNIWITVRSDKDTDTIAYYESLGLKVIIGDTEAFLTYLGTVNDTNLSHQGKLDSYGIPHVTRTESRPVSEYFAGFSANWNDIHYSLIPRTSHFAKIEDEINSYSNVLVVGMPFSGKTTLLMQLAHHFQTSRPVFYLDRIDDTDWPLFTEAAKQDGALVFVDDYSDAVDLINKVIAHMANIQLVIADRHYNVDVSPTPLVFKSFVRVDVSELVAEDFPRLFDVIPADIRAAKLRLPSVARDHMPSTLEFNQMNVRGADAKQSTRTLLSEYKSADPLLHDILLLSCYMARCRAPISASVLMSFVNTYQKTDYHAVMGQMRRLKQIVNDYSDVDLEDQDYFYPRSQFFHDNVIDCCSDLDFARVYVKFHNSVSLMNIPRFHTFRRYGYQNGYALRAFDNWEDGKKFYDDLYTRTNNFYDLQQAALYLNIKLRYKDAFYYINKARGQSKGERFSIRNTYARILFSSNYDNANKDSVGLGNLQDSMKILQECYLSDRRKVNHALLYAEQALQLNRILPRADCVSYLRQAKDWLEEEIKFVAMRRMKGLYREISRALGE